MEEAIASMQTFLNKNFEDGLIVFLASAAMIVLTAAVLLWLNARLYKFLARRGRSGSAQLRFLRRLIKITIIVLAIACILLQIKPFQSFVVSFLASSGIIAVILGFAAQEAMANLVSGMFISIFKPFQLGDRIKLPDKDIDGIIEDISMRHTVIRTFENHRVIVPNSIVNSAVIENINFEEDTVCNFFEYTVAYEADLEQAIALVREEAEKHPYLMDHRTPEERAKGAPKVKVVVTELDDYAAHLRAYVWSRSAGEGFDMLSDLRRAVKRRLEQEGIPTPCPALEVRQAERQ